MTNPLITIQEKLAHRRIAVCREGLDLAEKLLAAGDPPSDLLDVLEAVAREHHYVTIQDAAQTLLDRYCPQLRFAAADREHIFSATCHQCGNVSYFDKRTVCQEMQILRQRKQHKAEADLLLNCQHCNAQMVVVADCEGYQ